MCWQMKVFSKMETIKRPLSGQKTTHRRNTWLILSLWETGDVKHVGKPDEPKVTTELTRGKTLCIFTSSTQHLPPLHIQTRLNWPFFLWASVELLFLVALWLFGLFCGSGLSSSVCWVSVRLHWLYIKMDNIQALPKVEPKCMDGPLVAGCIVAHKLLVLHLSRWDGTQRRLKSLEKKILE